MNGEPVIPAPLDADDDDVAWALQTAAVQWQRGARADAVVWLRRAVDAAIVAGNPRRTQDLTRLAASVADRLVVEALAAPDSQAPARAPSYHDAPDVDDLLQASPEPSGAARGRPVASSLTNEIPVEFDDADDDLDDDDAPTIPPPQVRDDVVALDGEPGPDNSGDTYPDDDAETGEHVVSSREGSGSAPPAAPSRAPAPAYPRSWGRGSAVADARRPASEPPLDAEDEPFSIPPVAPRPSLAPPMSLAPPPSDEPFGVVESSRSPAALPKVPAPPVLREDDDFPEPPTADISVPNGALAFDDEAEGDTGRHDVAPEVPQSGRPADTSGAGGEPIVDGVSLDAVRGFEDLPEETQVRLARIARLTSLSADEEVGSFGAALVTRGKVGIMPSVADVSGSVATAGEVVFTRGTLNDGVPLRVVALEDGTVVASWSSEDLAFAMADCPWVADELRLVADRFQALAGATLGLLGERLDDSLRGMVTARLDVKAFEPGEIIVQAGKPIPGLHVVGGGRVELIEGDTVVAEANPGDFLFAAEVLAAGKAHATARAGKDGALILHAPRSVAHELLMIVPPLLEILAS